MLEDQEHWAGVFANNYFHMKNRSTNRAEGTHAAMKSRNLSVRDKMATATEKIIEWYEIRVSWKYLHYHVLFCFF
jgi:hypothetical protein